MGTASASCAQLDPLDSGCGNKVVEEGEDCDGNFDGQAGLCRGAGQPDACRFDCAEEACPSGYACGSDRICRRPSGDFVVASTVPTDETISLYSARIDGDDRRDLVELSQGRVSVRYIDVAGRVETTVSVPAEFNRPVLGDVTGEGLEDVLLFAPGFDGSGLAVFRSEANRNLAATVYTSTPFTTEGFWRLFTHDVIAPIGVHEVLAFTSDGIFSLDGDDSVGDARLKVGDYTPRDLAGFASGDLLNAWSPCPDIVVANKSATSVDVLSPCLVVAGQPRFNYVGDPSHFELPSVALPGNHRVRPGLEGADQVPVVGTGVFLSDVNNDGHLDLLVETLDNDAPSRAVAYGVGDGSFHSDPGEVDMLPMPASPGETFGDNLAVEIDNVDVSPCEGVATSKLGVPPGLLAVADFNEDGIGDAVGTYGLVVSLVFQAGSQPLFVPGTCATEPWARVVVDDFNGDEHLDLVAVPESGQDVAYLAGDGKGAFNRYKIRLDGDIAQVTSGDFDGDFRADLLVSVPFIDDDGEEAERLKVLYGSAGGNLEPPVELGVVEPLDYLMSGPIFGDDATSELAVFAKSGKAAFLVGSTDRLLLAPFGFFSPDPPAGGDEPAEEALIDFVTGHFSGPEALDIFALTQGFEQNTGLRAWLVQSDSLARLTAIPGPAGMDVPVSTTADTYDFLESGLRVEAADFDGDDLDEVLMLGGRGVMTLRWSSEQGQFERVAFSEFAESLIVDAWAPLVIADFDGDGTPERADEDIAFVSENSLVVLWNDEGIFDARAATRIAGASSIAEYGDEGGDPTAHPGLGEAGLIAAATALQLDQVPGADLVVVTDSGTYHLAYAGDREFEEADELEDVGGGRAIAGGDFTGDGVDDLVIAGDDLRIFKGIPFNP